MSALSAELEAKLSGVAIAVIAFTTIKRFLNASAFDVETRIMLVCHADTAMHLNGLIRDQMDKVRGARIRDMVYLMRETKKRRRV